MNLIDTHCHLTFSPLREHLDSVQQRAYAASVHTIIVPSYDIQSWQEVNNISATEGVFGAIGLHPWKADEEIEQTTFKSLLQQKYIVAVGEIGLDFKYNGENKKRQVQQFEMQLQTAQEMNLPVILHCRGAFEEMIQILQNAKPPINGVVHAFSRSPALAERFVNLGLHIAFGGAITRPNAKQAKAAAQHIPIERVLLETDAPSIALEGIPAEKVEPMHVAAINNALAQLRNMSPEESAAATTDNARRLFSI